MKILFVNSIGAKKWGGGEHWMVQAACGLQKRGHQVWLACRGSSLLGQRAKQQGLNVFEINIFTDFDFLNSFKIYRFLKKHQIDALICSLNRDVKVAGIGARLAKFPVVISRQGLQLIHDKWKYRFVFCHLADGIITNTESIKSIYDSFQWMPKQKTQVIYNGVRLNGMAPAPDIKEELGLKASDPLILSAGRLAHQKGFVYLIETARMAMEKGMPCHFAIIGKGRQEGELRKKIDQYGLSDRVHLMGFQDDVNRWLRGCDLFVLSSLYEGMPNAVMEAMAVGKPVIATDVNGVHEVIEDGVSGLIVPPAQPEIMFERLRDCLNAPHIMEQMGVKARERVHQKFTLDQMVDHLEAYLKEKIKEHHSR